MTEERYQTRIDEGNITTHVGFLEVHGSLCQPVDGEYLSMATEINDLLVRASPCNEAPDLGGPFSLRVQGDNVNRRHTVGAPVMNENALTPFVCSAFRQRPGFVFTHQPRDVMDSAMDIGLYRNHGGRMGLVLAAVMELGYSKSSRAVTGKDPKQWQAGWYAHHGFNEMYRSVRNQNPCIVKVSVILDDETGLLHGIHVGAFCQTMEATEGPGVLVRRVCHATLASWVGNAATVENLARAIRAMYLCCEKKGWLEATNFGRRGQTVLRKFVHNLMCGCVCWMVFLRPVTCRNRSVGVEIVPWQARA